MLPTFKLHIKMCANNITAYKPKIRLITKQKENFYEIKNLLEKKKLTTVCSEAHCPNKLECWQNKTATFMLLGSKCTRACRFCAVKTSAKGEPLDYSEPERIIEAIKIMNLNYVVLTSVDRDDLPDEGSGFFAYTISRIKQVFPNIKIECLIPDFNAKYWHIRKIVAAKPNVIAHNIETVAELSYLVRDFRANYEKSLTTLQIIKEIDESIKTKSSILLGFGEEKEQIIRAMKDLRSVNVDFLVLSQYLQPTDRHLPVKKYYSTKEFKELESIAYKLGFKFVVAKPLARTSYHAWKAEKFL